MDPEHIIDIWLFKNKRSYRKHTKSIFNEDSGTNYAQARYLCYYLQEKGLLRRYYHEFFKNKDSDPTGYKTLKNILDEDDMQAFQKKWEAYVLKLTFDRAGFQNSDIVFRINGMTLKDPMALLIRLLDAKKAVVEIVRKGKTHKQTYLFVERLSHAKSKG